MATNAPWRGASTRCSGRDPSRLRRLRTALIPLPREAALMRLAELVHGLPLLRFAAPTPGDTGDPVVTGVTHDSRAVAPGDLFVAFQGQRFDGRAFAAAPVARG